ncbi:MAG TPA: hypothetical protein VMV78_14525 [Thiobacillus sp.]|nr:hypothetical protein [Thiobacillus sp.]
MSTDREKRALLLVTYVHTASTAAAHIQISGELTGIKGNKLEVAVLRKDLIEPEDIDEMEDAVLGREIRCWVR